MSLWAFQLFCTTHRAEGILNESLIFHRDHKSFISSSSVAALSCDELFSRHFSKRPQPAPLLQLQAAAVLSTAV